MKLVSIDRAVSYRVYLNWLQDLKSDIVCDNGVSLQIKVVYMKFPNEVLVVVGLGNGPFYPNFVLAAALKANIFFWKSCMWVTCNNK